MNRRRSVEWDGVVRAVAGTRENRAADLTCRHCRCDSEVASLLAATTRRPVVTFDDEADDGRARKQRKR